MCVGVNKIVSKGVFNPTQLYITEQGQLYINNQGQVATVFNEVNNTLFYHLLLSHLLRKMYMLTYASSYLILHTWIS